MRVFWSGDALPRFWLAPALLGLILIVLGVLIFRFPILVQYFVAAVFVMTGIGLLGTALQMRTRVSIRRVDHTEDQLPSS